MMKPDAHPPLRPRLGMRRFDHDLARRMHSQGASIESISRELGVSWPSVKRACDDEYREKHRQYQRAGTCVDCGGPMSRNAQHRGPLLRCRSCYDAWSRKELGTSARERELHCAKCDRWKPDDQFSKNRSGRVVRRRRHGHCKECQRQERQEYRDRMTPEEREATLERDRIRKRNRPSRARNAAPRTAR